MGIPRRFKKKVWKRPVHTNFGICPATLDRTRGGGSADTPTRGKKHWSKSGKRKKRVRNRPNKGSPIVPIQKGGSVAYKKEQGPAGGQQKAFQKKKEKTLGKRRGKRNTDVQTVGESTQGTRTEGRPNVRGRGVNWGGGRAWPGGVSVRNGGRQVLIQHKGRWGRGGPKNWATGWPKKRA